MMKNYPINDFQYLIKKTVEECGDAYLNELLISYHNNGFIIFRPKDPNFIKVLDGIKKTLYPHFKTQTSEVLKSNSLSLFCKHLKFPFEIVFQV